MMPPGSRIRALGCAKVCSINRRCVASSHGPYCCRASRGNATTLQFQRERSTPQSSQDVTKFSYHEKQIARRERFIITRRLLLVVVGNLMKGLQRWRGELSHRKAARGRTDTVHNYWVGLWFRHGPIRSSIQCTSIHMQGPLGRNGLGLKPSHWIRRKIIPKNTCVEHRSAKSNLLTRDASLRYCRLSTVDCRSYSLPTTKCTTAKYAPAPTLLSQ